MVKVSPVESRISWIFTIKTNWNLIDYQNVFWELAILTTKRSSFFCLRELWLHMVWLHAPIMAILIYKQTNSIGVCRLIAYHSISAAFCKYKLNVNPLKVWVKLRSFRSMHQWMQVLKWIIFKMREKWDGYTRAS